MHKFDLISDHHSNGNYGKTAHSFLTSSTGIAGTQCSIRGVYDDDEVPKRHETSLNKNTINTPKNMRRFTFLKGTNGSTGGNINVDVIEEHKNNASLPKTASTIHNNRTQTTLDS